MIHMPAGSGIWVMLAILVLSVVITGGVDLWEQSQKENKDGK